MLNPITGSTAATGESYDPVAQEMTVRYKNGLHYVRSQVTPEMYAEFQAAPSKGAWLNQNFRKSPHLVRKVAPT